MKTRQGKKPEKTRGLSPLDGSRAGTSIELGREKGEPTVAGEQMTWIAAEQGRTLFQLQGHPLTAMPSGSDVRRFSGAREIDPAALLGHDLKGPPYAGWVRYRECRLYLSWGGDGYRLVHPHGRPAIGSHLVDPTALEGVLSEPEPLMLHGPPGAGKSLFAAMIAIAHADRGRRVVYVTGVPTHDIADGARIVHEIVPPGADPDGAREVLERWRPEVVILDLDSISRLAGVVRDLVVAGTSVLAISRAPDRGAARECVRLLTGNPEAWRFYAPWPVAPGPKLEISREAA